MSSESGASTRLERIPGSYEVLSGRAGTLVLAGTVGMWPRVRGLVRWLWAWRRQVCLLAVGLLCLAWGMGLLLFLRAGAHSPATVSLPSRKPHPPGEHNLVAHPYGVVLRASSYFRDRVAQHHPAFLVDGRAQPSLVEKWASDPTDTRPWIEMLWTGERNIHRVHIQHAGAVESAEYTAKQYVVTCLSPRAAPPLVVSNNKQSVAEHELRCAGAHGLRIDFAPNSRGALVRIFEVEVWGQ
jgi:hypothetical protein